MRGKSVDIDFISVFVEECVAKEMATPSDIASEAKIRINNIDHEIRRIETLKNERSKLVDVVNSFDSDEEAEDENSVFATDDCLSDDFTNQIAKYIGANLAGVSIKQILLQFGGDSLKEQIFFSVKKLAESGLTVRNTDRNFVPGPKWKMSA